MNMAEEIDLGAIIRQRCGLVAHDVDDTLVVTDERTDFCYGLDLIALRIWQLIERPQRVEDLCAALVDEYDIDRKRCELDVLEFLGELKSKGLIEIV